MQLQPAAMRTPITPSSTASKARQKSGHLAPPALPRLEAPTTQSDSHPARRPSCDLRPERAPRWPPTPWPACRAHYPGGSRRVHLSVASPSHATFPVTQPGRHPRHHFRGLLRLHSRYGPLARSTAQAALIARLRSTRLPGRTACQLPDQPTTLVDPTSTGATRPRAHWEAGL